MAEGIEIEELIRDGRACFDRARASVEKVIVGQDRLLEGLLIGLLADGHVLLEGLPGLAKTMAVRALATACGGEFRRIQFTPDLLPSDLVGTQVFSPKTGDWSVRRGPIFGNFILADEINRAPAKVQSALLEAMEEREVTLAGETHALPRPFLVMATQNPVDQEGTYPLPEAQVDRFMLKIVVSYPDREQEKNIVRRMADGSVLDQVVPVLREGEIDRARDLLGEVHVDEKIVEYVVALVFATREPAACGLDELTPLIRFGASPRASIALVRAARARAFLAGRSFVTPDDVKAIGDMVLRHRIGMTYEAEAEGVAADHVVAKIFERVAIP